MPPKGANSYTEAVLEAVRRRYKVGARYYDPDSSRWTQRDPLDNSLALRGWNRYIYAGDDPVNAIDPSGMTPWAPDCGSETAPGSGAYCGGAVRRTWCDQNARTLRNCPQEQFRITFSPSGCAYNVWKSYVQSRLWRAWLSLKWERFAGKSNPYLTAASLVASCGRGGLHGHTSWGTAGG